MFWHINAETKIGHYYIAALCDFKKIAFVEMFQEYVQGLPESLLKRQLDYDSNGVDHDLIAIAEHMINWEVDLVAPMKLTEIDVHDIRYHDHRPIMQRYISSYSQYYCPFPL